jgi:predicted nuclease of predicted toxin-antitoxin system
MKLLVDMNLSPEWLTVLSEAGWPAIHWAFVGSPSANDVEIFAWARDNGYVVLTQDMDFAQLLFYTQAAGPSVVMVRIRNELDSAEQARICQILGVARAELESGALVVIDEYRARLRRLPLIADDNV